MKLRNLVAELHVLIPYGPSNLNRNDIGEQKSAIVGNIKRGAVSSQCKANAIRSKYDDYYHTRHIVEEIERRYEEKFGKPCDFSKKFKKFADEIGPNKAVVAASNAEIDFIVNHMDEIKSVDELKARLATEAPINDDIALFGRMTTAGFGNDVISAVRRNYMFSIDPYTGDIDSFTTRDNLNQFFSEDSGSAHMGYFSFGSNIYYGYTSVDLGQLVKNFKDGHFDGTDDELKSHIIECVMKYFRDYITIHPTAKQSSMASMPTPILAFITVGENIQQITYDSLFEDVVRANASKSVGEIGTERILNYIVNDRPSFNMGEYTAQTMYLSSHIKSKDIDDLSAQLENIHIERSTKNILKLADVEDVLSKGLDKLMITA